MLKKLTPNLGVKNVSKSLEFYKEALGFEVVSTYPEEGNYVWGMVKLGGVEIMIEAIDGMADHYQSFGGKELCGTFTLYIETDDVQGYYEHIKGKASIAYDMHETFYGSKEFAVYDNNGYVLSFAGK